MKILAIPHYGTALGHVIRTGEILKAYYAEDDVYFLLPEENVEELRRYFSDTVRFIGTKEHFSVNNPSGKLRMDRFTRVAMEDQEIFDALRPDMVLDDPGVRGSVLHHNNHVDFHPVAHGAYLPYAYAREKIAARYEYFALRVWDYIHACLSCLLYQATGDGQFTWDKALRETVLIDPYAHLQGTKGNRVGFVADPSVEPAKVLLALSSEATKNKDLVPGDRVVELLAGIFGQRITVAGTQEKRSTPYAEYVGNMLPYESLVDGGTVVVCHGGSGTLASVEQAKDIFVYPQDLDQVCNALLRSQNKKYHLLLDQQEWMKRVKAGNPFTRRVDWERVLELVLARV